MLEQIDAEAVRRWFAVCLDGLGRARAEIDALNVFPVPDGDTGTNLYLTLESAVAALDALPAAEELDRTLRAAARGALLGARGNSGIILSQLFLGAGEVLVEQTSVGARTVAEALNRGAELAWLAVEHPVEGTVLSVARAAAAAAQEAAQGQDLAQVVTAAAAAAWQALARTPEQLPVLARAGVVDAGGRGLCVLLDALAEVVTGARPAPGPASVVRPSASVPDDEPTGACYEVMYLLEAPVEAIAPLRAALDALGDSLVVVGVEGLWSVHVHVDDAGAAIEAALQAGRPRRIRVTHLDITAAPVRHPARSVIAVATGAGVAELLDRAGVVVVRSPTGARPSTGELLDGMTRHAAAEVVLLPSDADTVRVAEVAAARARADGLRVAVVPARSMVATLAAVAVHDSGREFDEDVVAMTAAAGQTRSGGVTRAVRKAMTSAGICREGQALGLVNDDVAVIADDLVTAAIGVVDRLLTGGGELVTLLTGTGCDGLAVRVREHLYRSRPDVDVTVYEGGQETYALLVGVE